MIMMMNRIQEIDSFLKKLKSVLEKNPNGIDHDNIYCYLNEYMVDFTHGRADFEQYFDSWKKRFENTPNIRVFSHSKQPGFLQFWIHHPEENKTNSQKYIKLYLSIQPEYITNAVNDVFDFIAQNDIVNHSKVSHRDRSDSIVLRIREEQDARKVIEYVNGNEGIKSHAKPVNPFLTREGVVGAGFDDRISYNSAVAYLIDNYFKEKQYLHDTESIGAQDFSRYVKSFFRKTFITCENLDSFRSSSHFTENLARLRKETPHEQDLEEDLLVIFMHVTNMIGVSLNNNCNYGVVEEAFEKSKDSTFNEQYKSKFKEMIAKTYDNQELLDDYIRYAYGKYGKSNHSVFNYLNSYVRGNDAAITRDHGYRAMFMDNLDSEQVLGITNKALLSYIEQVTSNMKNMGYNFYVTACKDTMAKYGKNQLISALKNSFEGDFDKFTNSGDKKLRSKLKKYVDPSEIQEYLSLILETNGLQYDDEALLNVSDIFEDLMEKDKTQSSGKNKRG